MDLQDTGCRARFLIRDRDGKFPALFDAVLADAGIEVVLSGVRIPRMNSIMERWIQSCPRGLLDRTLIWNQRHLLHALLEFEHFYNSHRPHQGITNARPLHPLPAPLVIRDRSRFTRAFDEVFAADGIRILTSPPEPRAARQDPDCQRMPPTPDPDGLPSFQHRAATPDARA